MALVGGVVACGFALSCVRVLWRHHPNLWVSMLLWYLFSQGLGCFSGFVVSMLVAYLLMKRKIVKMMSGYQVLRSTLQFLGEFLGASLNRKRLVSLHKA